MTKNLAQVKNLHKVCYYNYFLFLNINSAKYFTFEYLAPRSKKPPNLVKTEKENLEIN